MAATAQAQETYRVKPGDVVRIEVLEDSSLNRDALVLPDGRISVPLVGTVAAGGRTVSQIRNAVTAELAPNFANEPTVFISLSRLAQEEEIGDLTVEGGVEVFVLGEVARPGKILVAEGTTLLQLFAEIGGFSRFASRKRMQLRRVDATGQERIINVNYRDVLQGRSNIGQMVMAQGDVVIIPERRLFE
jgi:polysaccharide export outer membrane protein